MAIVIDAVSFVDSSGNSDVKFRNRDFEVQNHALLNYIMTTICLIIGGLLGGILKAMLLTSSRTTFVIYTFYMKDVSKWHSFHSKTRQ